MKIGQYTSDASRKTGFGALFGFWKQDSKTKPKREEISSAVSEASASESEREDWISRGDELMPTPKERLEPNPLELLRSIFHLDEDTNLIKDAIIISLDYADIRTPMKRHVPLISREHDRELGFTVLDTREVLDGSYDAMRETYQVICGHPEFTYENFQWFAFRSPSSRTSPQWQMVGSPSEVVVPLKKAVQSFLVAGRNVIVISQYMDIYIRMLPSVGLAVSSDVIMVSLGKVGQQAFGDEPHTKYRRVYSILE
ncbi:hypothetical protein B0T14DRAFT_499759 [Immersiella caudata]|uniref:Uncharacterized protein n=1 Tax=Immersiella caudata TaxID=314043 RepID=A0AA39WFM8_9PEZI|nr:hypothetical protein B0T14DRAFT_499759 [Immersiella caudata]